MATSSISHNFVVKEKKEADKLIKALSMPKAKLSKPAKTVTGKKSISLLMSKWDNEK